MSSFLPFPRISIARPIFFSPDPPVILYGGRDKKNVALETMNEMNEWAKSVMSSCHNFLLSNIAAVVTFPYPEFGVKRR